MPTTIRKKAKGQKSVARRGSKKNSIQSIKSTESLSDSYNEFKQFDGHQYTGMAIGRSHKWYYDKGEWKETKITPDLWQISYAVTKRRAGKAPEGSGVPVGTGYHWIILSHQMVSKLNANDYTTTMTGLKFKLSHKRADKEKWNSTTKTQRKRLVEFLTEIIDSLQKDPIVFEFDHKDATHHVEAMPIMQTCVDDKCVQFEITLDGTYVGIIQRMKNDWKMEQLKNKPLVNAIGKALLEAI